MTNQKNNLTPGNPAPLSDDLAAELAALKQLPATTDTVDGSGQDWSKAYRGRFYRPNVSHHDDE